MPFKIHHERAQSQVMINYPDPPYQLISNPDGIQPVEWCQTCGRTTDIFWNGFQTICTNCDKDRAIRRKLKTPMVDNGISLAEFYYRLNSRIEAYGLD